MRIFAIRESSYKMVLVMWILHKGISLVHHQFIISHVVKKTPHTRYQTSNVAECTHTPPPPLKKKARSLQPEKSF
jgi:hypothetical protein